MRTAKPVSTISYNSKEFLESKLRELVKNHVISDYIFIYHFPEEDETKGHFHLWLKPNHLLDTMDLQTYFEEFDLNHPEKPLKCIDFRQTKDLDDWLLYSMHHAPYLALKFESRHFYYKKEDFFYCDEDSFNDYYIHALKGSKFAQQMQLLSILNEENLNPTSLISNGSVPLNMASNLSAYMFMRAKYGSTYRGEHLGHEDALSAVHE